MKGALVKDILLSNGYKLKDIADLMGETPQNLQAMLKVEDIKTGVLERISSAIGKSITFFFNEKNIDVLEDAKMNNDIVQYVDRMNFLYIKITDSVAILKRINLNQDPNIFYKYSMEAKEIMKIIDSVSGMEVSFNDSEEVNEIIFPLWLGYSYNQKKEFLEEVIRSLNSLEKIFFKVFNHIYYNIRYNKDPNQI